MQIDTSNWNNYRVGDIFSCETTKGIPSKNDLSEGDIPYITRSAINNGYSGSCGNESHRNKGNCITIGAEGFVAFWQDEDFVAGNKVYAIRHPKMNEYSGLFICTALNVLSDRYSFKEARILDKIKEEIIKLPTKSYIALNQKLMASLGGGVDMSKIDTSKWSDFRVGDLFDIRPSKNYGLTNANLFEIEGNTPVIVNSSMNNGVGGYVGLDPTEQGNVITFSDTTDANSIFYQSTPFVGYSHVQVMIPKEDVWNEDSLQFFATCFKQKALSIGFDYSNKFRRDIAENIVIKLPSIEANTPDWEYMESYMASVMGGCRTQFESLLKFADQKTRIDSSEWGVFRIGDLFDVQLSPNDLQPNKLDSGNMPLISSGRNNNGICAMVDENIEAYKFPTNTITVDMFGKAFFQPNEYFAVSHGRVNILIPKHPINEKCGLFLQSVIDAVANDKYSYSLMCTSKKIERDCLYLPAIGDKPNWDYIEQYMDEIMSKQTYVVESFKEMLSK